MPFLYKPVDKDELVNLVNDPKVSLGDIDTSLITDMSELFKDTSRSDFSGLENWNTSNVITMSHMFSDAENFNHPIGNWDTSKVISMSGMFS